jgi:hypothetical protein
MKTDIEHELLMDLNEMMFNVFNRYLGQGNFKKARVVFFGNESGCTGDKSPLDINIHLAQQILCNKVLNKNNGFTLRKPFQESANSTYNQFQGRFMLALENDDDKWFGKLSKEDKKILETYIKKSLSRDDSCNINLRPLPRPSERVWPYKISKDEYLNSYKISSKKHALNKYNITRIACLIDIFNFFIKRKDVRIIGIGDVDNKAAFFEKYLNIKLTELVFDGAYKLYYNKEHKIFLTPYWDNRCGIKLQGLKTLYNFLKDEQFI